MNTLEANISASKPDPRVLYLVDGSGYIFRAYFAIAPLSNAQGLPTNAVLGFSRMLLKLLRESSARYIAVCFDTGEPTFRHKLYDLYKANRAECPADLVPQMPYFRRVVQALGIQSLEKSGFEADDIIATLTTGLSDQVEKVVIVSGDKDLTQLVNDQVEVWDAMRDIHYTNLSVKEKFGVAPGQIRDFLAMTGDSSDNIPGVKGVGPKTAVSLLEQFGSVDNLYQNLEKIKDVKGLRGAEGVKAKLESSREEVRLSKELVSLDYAVKPFSEVSDVETFSWRSVNPELAIPLFEELGFSKLIDSLNINAMNSSLGDLNLSKANTSEVGSRYEVVTAQSFPSFVNALSKASEFAFDTETTSLDPFQCELVGISISWEAGVGYYLPLSRKVAGEGDNAALLSREMVREKLNPIFSNSEIKKCGCNLKFDLAVLEAHGYQVQGRLFDAMLASYVLNPDKRQHGLKAMAKTHLGKTMTSFEEVTAGVDSIVDVALDRLANYACCDADMTWQLKGVLGSLLGPYQVGESSPSRVFEEIEMPLVPVLLQMEKLGIKLDVAFLETLRERFSHELVRLAQLIYQHAGGEFNINSPKQLGDVLFVRLGIPTVGVKRTQTAFSTDYSVLQKLVGKHEIIPALLEYRELFKLQSTYVEALIRIVNPQTGRVHTSFNQAVAATGRLSSSEPNLQNIPIRNARGRELRQSFVAEDGFMFICADYSQIELRVLAELSGDQNLKQAFIKGEDIHAATARELFGGILGGEREKAELRRVAKTINFGIIYGMSAFRLAQDLGISRRQAQDYIDGYFARYPKVKDYFARSAETAEEKGYVETYFGRRRYLSDIDISGRDRGYVARSAMNAPLQGTAADIIKLAMIALHKALIPFGNQAQMVLQVHDELVIEAREELAEKVKNVVVETMESAVKFTIPLKVDVRVAKSWGTA